MKTSLLQRSLAAAAFSLLLCSGQGAFGQGTTIDPETIYRSAVEDMKAGRYAEACPKFAEARRRKPDSTPALMGLAQCYEKVGKTASAWAKYRELSVELKSQGEQAKADTAAGRAEELGKALSTLTIKPEGSDTPGLQIQLDKEEVPKAMLGTKMNVDPGQHVLQATAPGYEVWQTTITIGAKNDVREVKVPALTKAIVIPPPDPKQGPHPALRPAAFAVGGVGVAGLVLGGVFGGLAMSGKSELGKLCPNNACPEGNGSQDKLASAKTKGLISTVGFSVGGAALATGVVLFVLSTRGGSAPKQDERKTSFVPTVGPGFAGFATVGSF